LPVSKKEGISLSIVELKEKVQALGADLVGKARVVIHLYCESMMNSLKNSYLVLSRLSVLVSP